MPRKKPRLPENCITPKPIGVISITVCPRGRFCMFVVVFIKSVVLPVPVVSYLGQSSILSHGVRAEVLGSECVRGRERILYSMAARVLESRGEGGRGSLGAGVWGRGEVKEQGREGINS